MKGSHVALEEEGRVGILTLERPEKRNALSLDLIEGLHSALEEASARPHIRVLVVRGAGGNFSSGHDLREILGGSPEEVRHLFDRCAELMARIQGLPQPVIAQVRGVATAAGCQLVAACDLAVAEEEARFATPGVKIGLFCSTPMVPLSRAVGRKRALEMLLTGEFVSAREAASYGLVNRVVPADRLEAETMALAEGIARYSRTTLGIGKQAFYRQMEMTQAGAYHYGKEVITLNASMPAAREGMAAFLEKREPDWGEE